MSAEIRLVSDGSDSPLACGFGELAVWGGVAGLVGELVVGLGSVFGNVGCGDAAGAGGGRDR